MKNKKILYIIPIAIIALLFIIIRVNKKIKNQKAEISFQVKKGEFGISVNATGELESEKSTQIRIPAEILKGIEIWEISLSYILPEGTMIDSGNIVAELDPSVISEKLVEVENNMNDLLTELENAKADTALELSGMRDELLNQQHEIKELEITLHQSRYESPSVIKQAELSLEKAKRSLEQKKKNYDLKIRKSGMVISQIRNRMHYIEIKKQKILDAFEQIKIKSPGNGMLIYYKNMAGIPIKSGTTIPVFADNTIAIIPDFSSMISRTYVNEIEISKVKTGQKVNLGVDAYPDEKYSGEVINVANIGEKVKGRNTKVFEVVIRLDNVDSFLKPGMTTSNEIMINTFPEKLYVPLESVHNENGKNYVFKSKGLKTIKKEVVLGEMNENFITIEEGIDVNDKVLLSIPEGSSKMEIIEL